MIQRKKPLARFGKDGPKPLKRTPLKRVNAERKAKRQARYKKYLSSADWRAKKKAVRERSGGRCERWLEFGPYEGSRVILGARCVRPAKDVHHLSYGTTTLENVRLEQLQHLCTECHREITAAHNANHMGRF